MKAGPVAEYLEGPICRMCRYALKAESGCTFCRDVKAHLAWPVIEQVEATETAKSLSQYTAQLLRRQLKKLEREVNSLEYSSDATKELVSITRALTGLTDQIRKLEDREAEITSAMTFEEQCRLIVREFFARLPQEHQNNLLTAMRDVHQSQSMPYFLEGNVETAD